MRSLLTGKSTLDSLGNSTQGLQRVHSNLKAREYQLEGIGKLRKNFAKGKKRQILCMPTGSGKTFTACCMIDQSVKKNKRVDIVVHRIEIMYQFHSALKSFGIDAKILHGPYRDCGQVNLSMVETYYRRYPEGRDIDVLFIDEVHFGSFGKILKSTTIPVIGLTATPVCSKEDIVLNEIFDDIVVPIKVSELIAEGSLLPARTFSEDYDFSKLRTKMGDFDVKQMANEFEKPHLKGGALKNYRKLADGRKTICFNVNVSHSLSQRSDFSEHYQSIHIDNSTGKEQRREMFKSFGESQGGVMHNVGIATTGTDIPSVGCIIENRATQSLALHHQMIGRGARIYPGMDHFIIIDQGCNWKRHGLYGEDVNWKAIFDNPKRDQNKEETQELRSCKECGAVVPLGEKCKYCGAILSVPPSSIVLEQEEEGEIMNAKEIKARRLKTLPANLRGRVPSEMTFSELIQYGQHLGYSDKWARIYNSKRRN